MITKWNRESLLVTVMAIMILFGLFFYGHQYLIDPVKTEADLLSGTVEQQQALLTTYPPNEELKTELETTYLETESYLPIGVQANQELITLEQAANESNVMILSVSRVADHQAIEEVPENFVSNMYEVQMASDAPTNFRTLIDRLMNEERVWNVTSFTYDKAAEANYAGTFSFELSYYSDNPVPSEERMDEMAETENNIEE